MTKIVGPDFVFRLSGLKKIAKSKGVTWRSHVPADAPDPDLYRLVEEDFKRTGDWIPLGRYCTGFIKQGTPLYARNVIRSYHRLLTEGKIQRHGFHDLRHSCATFLLAKNIPARTVMEILGHSNISLTMNTYSHVMPEMLRDAADAMNEVMSQSNIANS